MANYVYTMNRVGKIVPPKRHILKDISLSFFPGAKIGVLGLMQYVVPTMQLLLGVWLYHEPFGAGRLVGFALIWGGLALYSAEGAARSWRGRT